MALGLRDNRGIPCIYVAPNDGTRLGGSFWAKPLAQTVTALDETEAKAFVALGGVNWTSRNNNQVRFTPSACHSVT